MFNIDKLKTFSVDEYQRISTLFGVNKTAVSLLLDYGFEYNYSCNEFKSIILINNSNYTIYIKKEAYSYEIKSFYIQIIGAKIKNDNTHYLYDDKINNISSVSFQPFIIWIKNIYETNNIDNVDKETFKTFVEKDKKDSDKL